MSGAGGRAWTVRAASPTDRDDLVRLLVACSPETLHHRFLTGMGGIPRPAVVTRLLARDAVSRAVLAVVHGQVVGHGMCARVGPSTVEIALLVRDDHQRRGVGTALVTALREEAAAMGAVSVELTTGADNRAVVAMVSARAPGLRARRDGTTLVYRLPLPPAGPDAAGTRSLRWESPLRRTARTHHCDTRTGPQHDRRGPVLPSGAGQHDAPPG